MVDMANGDNADVNLPLTRYEFLAQKLTYKSRYKKRKSLALEDSYLFLSVLLLSQIIKLSASPNARPPSSSTTAFPLHSHRS